MLLIIPILFLSWNNSLSIAPNCEGDPCVTATACGTWVQASPMIIDIDPVNCPQCTIEVHYKYRDNSGCDPAPCPSAPPFEFRIDFVITDGSCFYPCNGNPPLYQFGDLEALYMKALYELTKFYSKPFKPGKSCGPVIPNFAGTSCKKEYEAPNGNIYILDCYNYECCIQNLQYCEDVNGNGRLIKTDVIIPNDDCEIDPDGSECYFSCDWDWEESNVPKRVKIRVNDSYNNYKLNFEINSNTIQLELIGELNNEITINIFNSNGESLLLENYNVQNGRLETTINQNYPSGAYFIAYYMEGKLIKIHSFNITR